MLAGLRTHGFWLLPVNTKTFNSNGSKIKSLLLIFRRNTQAVAAIFAIAGLLLLIISFDDIQILRQKDALFGITTRMLLIFAGLLHLFVSGYLFASRYPLKQGTMLLWFGWNYLLYLVAMVWVIKAETPFPVMTLLAWKIGVTVHTLTFLWKLFIPYLILAGFIVV